MTVVGSPVSPRHVRHRKRSRLRRSVDFKKFLVKLQVVLNATGAAVASWTAVSQNAAGTLTTTGALANADTITIGSNVYTMQSALTAGAGHVKQTGTVATDLATLVKAINGTGLAGTDYGTGTVAHPDVTATSDATHLILTAKVAGVAGNAIASTKVAANATFGATTLTGGVAQSSDILKTAHGKAIGEGPFLATNSGGALPAPLNNSTLYWVVSKTDANHFGLATHPRAAPITLTSAGSGTNTITKASSLEAVYDLLKKHGAPFMKAATDVDGI